MKSYRSFLIELEEELFSAMAEAENESWHHAPLGSVYNMHYTRLCTWYAEVRERREKYAETKRTKFANVRRSAQEA